MKKLVIGLVLLSSMSVFARESMIATQVKLINKGMISGEITEETKDFFLKSIADMQHPSKQSLNRVNEFTKTVCNGIAKGQITEDTKYFFLKAVEDFGQSCN